MGALCSAIMTRRGFLISGASLLVMSGPSYGSSYENDVAAELQRDGYRITYRKRTWLGRIRFKAHKGQTVREVVVDPTSGEVLRDYSEKSGGNDKASRAGGGQGSGESGGGESGSGESGGEESGGEESGGDESDGDERGEDARE